MGWKFNGKHLEIVHLTQQQRSCRVTKHPVAAMLDVFTLGQLPTASLFMQKVDVGVDFIHTCGHFWMKNMKFTNKSWMASIVHHLSLQMRTTGCSMLRGRSKGRSPSGVWVCRCPGSRRHCAGATTPTTTPTSSCQAATGGSAPVRTEWSPSTRAACRTGAASLTTWTPLSGTSTVRVQLRVPIWGFKKLVC